MTKQQATFQVEYLQAQLGSKWPSATFAVKEFTGDSANVVISYKGTIVADFRDQARAELRNVRKILVEARDAQRV